MPEQLNTRVEDCFLLAESFFKRSFKRPVVSLKLRGQKAGVAHLHENLLRFNPQLYRENAEDFLKQTVAHEVAHLIAHQLFGDRIQPHGEEWQLIMRGVYELPPNRCHTYEVQRRSVTRYIYRCPCAQSDFRSPPSATNSWPRAAATCVGVAGRSWFTAVKPGSSERTPAPRR